MFDRKWIFAATVLPVVVLYFLLGDAAMFAPGKSSGQYAGRNGSESVPTGQGGTYPLHGRVVEVTDGDTLRISVGSASGDAQRVRLASIDAPERTTGSDRPGQPLADASRQFLAGQVQGRTLMLACFEQDPYGRHICDVPDAERTGATVNQALVAAGLAWANMEGKGRFLRDRTMLDLQSKAQSEKLGIWSKPDPVAPWVWRYQCWRKGQCQ